MKRTGELLKKEREARGLSIHEIGLSLKINSKILKAIEEGETDNLPAKTFLRGFVQSYASYLKLNVDEVLKVFTEEMGSTRPHVPTLHDESAHPAHPKAPEVSAPESVHKKAKAPTAPGIEESSSTKAIIFSLIAVLLAGLITFTVKIIDKYQKEAEVATIEVNPIENLESDDVEEPQVPPPTAATTETAVLPPAVPPVVDSEAAPAPTPKLETPPKEETPAPVEKKVEAPVVPPPSTPPAAAVVPSPTGPPVAVKEEPKKPEVAAAPTTPAPTPTPAVPSGRSLEVIVEALDNVEIEYSAGNGKKNKIRMGAEQVHTFKSTAGLQLNISNGGAVNLILNGKDLGVPGDLGKPIKLNY